VPTRGPTLGVKDHRPGGGPRDGTDLLSVLAVVNAGTGVLHATTRESPARAKSKTGPSQGRRRPEAFAVHRRHGARLDPAERHARGGLIRDNALWHRGGLVDAVPAEPPQLELDRLPSSSPQRNVIERFGKLRRRRATPNRRFDTLADLKRSRRASLGSSQTMRGRVRSLIAGCYTRPANQTGSVGV
jgi:hypothetical protein